MEMEELLYSIESEYISYSHAHDKRNGYADVTVNYEILKISSEKTKEINNHYRKGSEYRVIGIDRYGRLWGGSKEYTSPKQLNGKAILKASSPEMINPKPQHEKLGMKLEDINRNIDLLVSKIVVSKTTTMRTMIEPTT